MEEKSHPFRFKKTHFRLLALAFFMIGAYVLAKNSSMLEGLDPYALRDVVSQWGGLSIGVFIAFYVIGLLLYVPGTLFTVAGALLFGQLHGIIIVWVASNIAMNVSFIAMRLISGNLLSEVEHPFIDKMMRRLDKHPIQTVAVLRIFLYTAPGLNTVFALSRLRGIDHFRGTLLGAIIPTATVVIATDWVLLYFYA